MKWLITGGCGFIGTSLIRALINKEEAYYIRVLDNLSTGTKEDLALVCAFREVDHDQIGDLSMGVELVIGDIIDEELAIVVSNDVDIIVHLAANTGVGPSVENPRLDYLVNVLGTFNFLEAARINNISKFVFASSSAMIGEVVPPIHEQIPPQPVSPYGASKLAGEGYCSAYKQSFEIDTIALRFANVYGPGSTHKNSVVAKFIRRALNGEVLEIYGDGDQSRDFIYIEDLVNAVILAANNPEVSGEVFQIASGQEKTLNELTDLLIQVLESKGIKGIRVTKTEKRVGDVRRNFSDISKAKYLLGWQPSTTLSTGLCKTANYFLKKGN